MTDRQPAAPVVGEVRQRLGASVAAVQRVLRNPDLRRLEIAWTLSIAAEWALIVALLVYAYDLGGAVAVGLLGVARTLPTLVGVPLVTTFADGRRRTRVLAAVYLIALATAIATAVGLALDAGLVAILVIAAANAVATAAIRPIQNAIIPSLARSPEELVAANVASSAGEGLGVLIGPGFGGILLVFGTPVVAAAGAVGMALATLAFTQVRSDAGASTSVRADALGHRHRPSVLVGIRALRTLPTQALVMALFGLQPMVRGILTVLIVVASIELLGLGDPGVGLLNSAIGLGSILGSVGTVVLIGRRRLAPVFLLALVFWGIPIVIVGVAPVALVAVVAMGVVGISNAVLDVAGYTVLQRTIPNHVRASVFGLFEGYVAAMAGVGGIVAPVLVALFGVAGALVAAGAILPLAVLVAARWALRVDDIALVPARQLALVRGVAMFAPLPITAIEELAASLEPLRFGPGETLMRAGEVGDRFLLIDTGSVEVEADGAIVRTIGPGGHVGEIALLRGIPRTATVRTLTEVTAYGLGAADFIAAVTGDRESVRSAGLVVDARLANQPDAPA